MISISMDDAAELVPGLVGSGPEDARLETVGDTALMVAACRALETERPDGLVRDPFARQLAGERGLAIAKASPIPDLMCFAVGVRARFFDELLMESLAPRVIQVVLNLGSGLDTRPWRLHLDPDLRWIEADLPEMLEYKAARLRDVPPRCRLEQVPANLADGEARSRLFRSVGTATGLMITEGLLMYLSRATVKALAAETQRLTGIRYWLLDTVSPEMMRMAPAGWKCPVEKFRAEDHLAGQGLLDVAVGAGWSLSARRTYARDAARVAAARVASLVEKAKQSGAAQESVIDEVSGFYRFEHI